MKVIVVDETRTRALEISEKARSKNMDVVCCSSSNDFMNAIGQGKIKAIAMDVESWKKGSPIYGYFGIARKLVDIPLVFFNAPEGFTALPDRPKLDKDVILPLAAPVESVVESLAAA